MSNLLIFPLYIGIVIMYDISRTVMRLSIPLLAHHIDIATIVVVQKTLLPVASDASFLAGTSEDVAWTASTERTYLCPTVGTDSDGAVISAAPSSGIGTIAVSNGVGHCQRGTTTLRLGHAHVGQDTGQSQ